MTDFTAHYTHVVRELRDLGYVVVAPEYRGSTGYGKDYQQAIDYGGLEVDDNIAARHWTVEALPFVNPQRVGLWDGATEGLLR